MVDGARLLTIDPGDFLRLLERSFGETPVLDPDTQTYSLPLFPGRVEIHMQTMPPRRLGSLHLPQQSISFCFRGATPQSRQAFLSRLAQACQRLGG